MSKFKVGDKVKVVNYGHLIWMSDEMANLMREPKPIPSKGEYAYDLNPSVVGKGGVVKGVDSKGYSYALDGIAGKTAWFEEDQLELVGPDTLVGKVLEHYKGFTLTKLFNHIANKTNEK